MMHASYDPLLVALSIVIAIFAAYTALELAARAPAAEATAPGITQHEPGEQARTLWIAAASLAMGGGIWSMHFVGMLALQTPVTVTYRLLPTLLSFLVAVAATAGAFFWVSRPRPRTPGTGQPGPLGGRAVIGGTAMGAAIAGMHYIGMSAMRMPMELDFVPGRVALSVLIAVVASIAGLALAFRRNSPALRAAAAVTMGLAVAGMHYTGMWAAHFTPTATPTLGAAGNPAFAEPQIGAIGTGGLVLWVMLVTFLILFLALMAATLVQHRAARALRLSEARFRVAAASVGDIIWTNTADGRMRYPQPGWQAFTGQSPPEFQDYGWAEVIHPDDREATTLDWRHAVATRGTFAVEHRVRRRDGEWRLCAVRANPVLDEAGQIQEWVGVHADITERHQAEADLRQAKDRAEAANAAKSTFIANMSHELRTPLAAIIGYSETLEESLDDEAPAAELRPDLARIQSNAKHLLGLINDVLDLSKVEAGRLELHIETVDLAPLLDDVLTTVRPLCTRRANRLVTDFPNPVPTIRTDPAKLRQMLLNLLGNAAKFTSAGTVTLALRGGGTPQSPTTIFDITDTGIGIPEEHQARLFERFSQADASTTRRFGGTGLGLALTRAFSDGLGGTIRVQSVPGQGSTFTLELPNERLIGQG